MIDKLTSIKPVKSQDPTIPATATRTLIASFPRPLPGVPPAKSTHEAYGAISKVLIPRLLGRVVLPQSSGSKTLPAPPRGMLEFDEDGGSVSEGDAIDVLNELVRCFGPLLQEREVQTLAVRLGEIVASDSSVVSGAMRKKAVAGVAQLSVYFTDPLLDDWVQTTTAQLQYEDISPPKRRVLVSMIGQVARAVPRRLGTFLPKLAPLVLGALTEEGLAQAQSQMSEDGVVDPVIIDMKEGALITLEDLISCCVSEMVPYTDATIAACILHLSFDPGMIDADDEMDGAEDDDEAEVDEDDAEDEDFEEEDQLSDDEDTSWKVRRCAAKALHSLIATRSTDLIENGELFNRIAPALIRRFNEREENVKLEVLATSALLVKKTRDNAPVEAIENGTDTRVDSTNTRKRRRGSSDASMYDPEPIRMIKPVAAASERQELSALGASMVSGVIKMLPQKSIATKQAATVLLREYVLYKHDGLNSDMEKVMNLIIETIRGKHLLAGSSTLTAGTSTFASVNSLRIQTLDLLHAISDTHASNITNPFLPKVAEALVVAIGDQYFKVSCHAIRAAESVLESIATPTSPDQQKKIKAGLDVLLNEIIERARSPKSELEVRQDAIHAMAVCLAGSTAAAKLTSPEQRKAGLSILEDRLRNETTRLASLQAVKRTVSCMDQLGSGEKDWLQKVATEIAQQLRKSDPKVRGSSLLALRAVVSHESVVKSLSVATMREIQNNLLPLLGTNNVTNPAVAMEIMENMIAHQPRDLATPELNTALCSLLLTPLGTSALDALLSLVEAIGKQGVGDPLMQSFLQNVGVGGDPSVVGLAIGTLLVSGGPTIKLSVAELQKELQTAQDDQRRCLALAIFGEVALRQGARSDIGPKLFLDRFTSRSDQVSRVAAAALGRAAVGNVSTYLPAILPLLKQPGDAQLLLLHSVKEMLQHADKMRGPLDRYSEEIWTSLLSFSESEDTRVISAECAGRLAALEPKKYLPMLQVRLPSFSPSIRALPLTCLPGLPPQPQSLGARHRHPGAALRAAGGRRGLRRGAAAGPDRHADHHARRRRAREPPARPHHAQLGRAQQAQPHPAPPRPAAAVRAPRVRDRPEPRARGADGAV